MRGDGADLFETYAVTLVAVMFLGAVNFPAVEIVHYPLVIGGVAILASVAGTFFARIGRGGSIMAALYKAVIASTVISALLHPGHRRVDGDAFTFWELYGATLIGLAITFLLVAITEFYRAPVGARSRDLARLADRPRDEHHRGARDRDAGDGPAGDRDRGGDRGAPSSATPPPKASTFGIAVMAQLSMTGLIVALDAYGPVTDNAGGIAEMAELDESVRAVTDPLDAQSETTRRSRRLCDRVGGPRGADPLRQVRPSPGDEGLTAPLRARRRLGDRRSLPRRADAVRSSLAMQAVGRVGGQVVEEVRRQFREIRGSSRAPAMVPAAPSTSSPARRSRT